MKLSTKLSSTLDESINFIFDNNLEARFVQRTPEYFIGYLSSHDGCNKACRFCHLTQTKQTSFNPTTIDQYLIQVDAILAHYVSLCEKGKCPAEHVNFNFMSRGEPLANPLLIENLAQLNDQILIKTRNLTLTHSLNISSIVPRDTDFKKVQSALQECHSYVALYYSLYSLDPSFRKNWMPNAANPHEVIHWLAEMQSQFELPVTLHWAFIEGQNDKIQFVQDICNLVHTAKLDAKFNLVRYNPFSAQQGAESSEITIKELFNMVQQYMTVPGSRIVPKVGFDVKASCGMFISPEKIAQKP